MANITRRYWYKGPWPLQLKASTDPSLVLPSPSFVVSYDVTWDDAVANLAAMDEQMRHYGCFPEAVDTRALSPSPFLGVLSPDGSVWKLQVDNLGMLTTVKVSP